MSKQKLFFSYSRNDAASFASKLANDLEQAGFDIWIDQQDIPAGRNWDLEIEQALESCDCLLFIESEKSVASNNVLDEVYYALGQNKKVIPVIYHDSKTPFRLQRLQHIDFTKDYEAGLANLLAELRGQKYPHSHGSQGNVNQPPAGFFKKYLIPVLIVILLFVAGTVALLRKKGKYQDEQQHKATVANIDTGAKVMNKVKTIEEPETVRIESPAVQTTAATSTPSINAKRKFVTPKIITTPKIVNNTQPTNAAPAKLSPDGLAGHWQLVKVLPKHASH
ncbi:MAG: toll/interleukin-1 receptor domain-containing protein, partial [Chitinophagaceae bacterium]